MQNPLERDGRGAGAVALALLCIPLALGVLLVAAPNGALTEHVWRPLLVASGPAIPLAVMLALVALGQGAKGRAIAALVLFLPALTGPLLAVRRAQRELPPPITAPAPPPPSRPR